MKISYSLPATGGGTGTTVTYVLSAAVSAAVTTAGAAYLSAPTGDRGDIFEAQASKCKPLRSALVSAILLYTFLVLEHSVKEYRYYLLLIFCTFKYHVL